MPRIERDAEIVWEGNLARGEGRVSAASSGAFRELPISLASRVGDPQGRTSPEELLAAAHGGCFATALAGELSGLGHPPGRLELSCRVVMDEVEEGGHQILSSGILVAAFVPGLDAETLARAVALADEGCPFSALLKRGGANVSVKASLQRQPI